jgi:glycerophosphoryl diester phosphodiesterase
MKMKPVFAWAVAVGAMTCAAEDAYVESNGSQGIKRTDLLYISHVHRGGGKLECPDNTLDTFKWCWENGSALECDCRMTKDGVGIMLHDDTLRRTVRGIPEEMLSKSVSKELTWAEIKDVDAGSYLDKKFAHHRIPTIEETFAAMKGRPTYLCFVDDKGAGPAYIARKAVEAGVQDQVYYTGPSHAMIFKWNEILPAGKSLLWLGAWPKNRSAAERARADAWFRDALGKLRSKAFKYISAVSIHTYYDPKDPVDPFIPSTPVLKELVSEFHAHHIPVVSIPFAGGDTEEVYFKLFELGMDGFSTDYPSVMFSVIRKLKAGGNE